MTGFVYVLPEGAPAPGVPVDVDAGPAFVASLTAAPGVDVAAIDWPGVDVAAADCCEGVTVEATGCSEGGTVGVASPHPAAKAMSQRTNISRMVR